MVCKPVVHINFHNVGLVCMTVKNDNGCMSRNTNGFRCDTGKVS